MAEDDKGGYSQEIRNYQMLDYEYSILMSAMHVSVSKHIMDDGFTVIWANDYYYEKTGYTKEEYEELFHSRCGDYFKTEPEEYSKIYRAIENAIEENKPSFECICRMPQKNGGHIWIRDVGTFTNEVLNGYPVIYSVFTDITDIIEQRELQKKLEERSEMLRNALEMAERANHAKSDFLSRMSHDIRTPMNAIMGMIAIAKDSKGDMERLMDCLTKVETSAKFLLTLINDILDMSKIESGKMVLKKKRFNFAIFLRDITTMFYAEAVKKNLQFQVFVGKGMEEEYIGDELKLNQILINLLGNAVKFTDEGGSIQLSVERGKSTGKSTELIFVVKDTGIGMEEGFQEKIFKPFEQEFHQRGNRGGSGLGLAIAGNYARMMNGQIDVKSKHGEGSEFYVYVWLEEPRERKPVDLKERFRGLKTLIVDNDSDACDYTKSLMQKFGVEADYALSAEEAMERLQKAEEKESSYHIVIIDWKPTQMDGIKLAESIRDSFDKDGPIVAFSAYDWSYIKVEVMQAGANHFLQKPLFPSVIYDFLISITQDKPLAVEVNYKSFEGEKILLVEDNDINLEIGVTLLKSRNLQVETARDGMEAIACFKESEPGYYMAILMDIQMPIMDGLEATRRIRALDKADAQTVPIVAMSANAFDDDVEKSLEAGMNAHISKPIDIPVLFETLHDIKKKEGKGVRN